MEEGPAAPDGDHFEVLRGGLVFKLNVGGIEVARLPCDDLVSYLCRINLAQACLAIYLPGDRRTIPNHQSIVIKLS